MQATLYTKAPEVQEIVKAAFPEYAGKRFSVSAFNGPMTLTSYWSGGSRDYFAFVSLESERAVSVPENGTPWVNPNGFKVDALPENIVLVRYTKGLHESTCVYVRPENMTKFLPAPAETTREQKIVLSATRSLKSSYAGIKDYRFNQAREYTGISREAWEQAKGELIAKGLLNKAGAITDEGRNVIGWTNLSTIGKA